MMHRAMGVVAAVTVLLAGCVSSDVRNLARSTAANVSVVNTGLTEFKERSQVLVAGRAATADRLNYRITEELQYLDLELEAAKLAGETSWVNEYNTYLKLADKIVEQQRRLDAADGALRAVILKGQKDLALPAAELSRAEKLLSELAAEPGTIEQLAFFKAFFGEVLEAYKNAKTDQDKAEQSAIAKSEEKQAKLDSLQPIEKICIRCPRNGVNNP